MSNKRIVAAVVVITFLPFGACFAQTLEQHWNDFLHYTLIGQLDLAKGHAQAILQSNPDPVELLALREANPQAEQLLTRAKESPHDPALAELAGKLWDVIEQGRFLRRSAPKLIVEEIERLGTTDRGRLTAVSRLRTSGEYAIPYMLDAMTDPARRQLRDYLVWALPQIGKDATRPLTAALQTKDVSVRAEIIKALGGIAYPQSLCFLRYVIEKDDSAELRTLAQQSIAKIDPAALNPSAAQLFYQSAEEYYYHSDSLAPAEDVPFANIWLWDAQASKLIREKVDKSYFFELMAMRLCEWSLKADPAYGQAIGLWLAAYFKAESANVRMPGYFAPGHPDAFTYATTAGPEYLHQALARAVRDKNAYVALGVVEALAINAGEKSLMYRLGEAQPLVQALSFDDRAVRYSAAIAIASAGPKEMFPESKLVVDNLVQALGKSSEPTRPGGMPDPNRWNEQVAHSYAVRALRVMLKLAQTRNPVVDLSPARTALIEATETGQTDIRILAGQVLAYFNSPEAQRAIISAAVNENNPMEVRISAFESLATSAKLNANLLDSESIDAVYRLIGSAAADPDLRKAAAAAFGALNLPSQKVKDLILDQARD